MGSESLEVSESAHGAASNGRDVILEVKNLKTFFYQEDAVVKAVNGVSFDLQRHRSLGIVGESGCGKSVTSLSIMRLVRGPRGRIVDGQILYHHSNQRRGTVDLVPLDPMGRTIRRIRGAEIAMIFQEPMTSLNPLYTIGSQIAEAVQEHQDVGKKEAMARALEMLHSVNIADPARRLREYPHQLSGGMRQRVMIAMALSCNPAILIADEPTTALDVTIQAQILDLMRKLQDDFSSSIVLITHNLGVVSQMVDQVIVMYLGRIVEKAATHTLFHNPAHPYTQGLIQSVPVFGRKGSKVLVPIPGTVPRPTEDIRGCPFASRCKHVMKRCTEEMPPMREIESGHLAACFLYEK